VGYLSFCKRSRQRATVDSARMFMAEVEGRSHDNAQSGEMGDGSWEGGERGAESGKHLTPGPSPHPMRRGEPLAASDLGGLAWERGVTKRRRAELGNIEHSTFNIRERERGRDLTFNF
jgi:hypothetical protein